MNDEQQNLNQSNSMNPQANHESTQKAVDAAAKGAALYFGGEAGAKALDTAKSTPVVGNAIQGVENKVAEGLDHVPGVQNVAQKLDQKGVTDAVNTGLDAVSGANKFKGKTGTTSDSTKNYRKNTSFGNRISNESSFDSSLDSQDSEDEDSQEISTSSDLLDSSLNDSIDNTEQKNDNNETRGAGIFGNTSGDSWISKHRFLLVFLGIGGVFLFLFLLLFLVSGNEIINTGLGYYDQACNFNDTRVTVTNCYQNSEDSSILYDNLSLEDYIIGATYAYTEGYEYSDDAIKAMMITLKTNALSYGNYHSSSKSIEVKSCNMQVPYCDVGTGCSFKEEGYYTGVVSYLPTSEEGTGLDAASDSYISKLQQLYKQISNYIYVSSSYQSAISTLSERNALLFDGTVLNEFQSLSNEKSYSEILDEVYGGGEETTEVVIRDTLYLGDSRMKGMQLAGVVNNSNSIYGVGYGYNWLVGDGNFTGDTNSTSGGLAGIRSLMDSNTNYNIVIWLGVNDLYNVNNYFVEYSNLAKNEWSKHEIYIVSVGGVVESTASNYGYSVTNAEIDRFNETMKDLILNSGVSNLHYMDIHYDENAIQNSSDGLHYGNTDYQGIYALINSNLDYPISENKSLYNLNEYCTYYNLTENDAYWWPVGSANPTNGNIYGGEPMYTHITSYFGIREAPTEGASTNHGAIDIGTPMGTPVISMTNGTVKKIVDKYVDGVNKGTGRGNYVLIDHGNGIEAYYQHLLSATVTVGQVVQTGELIGYSGNTGTTSGPHLHFEIHLSGIKVNPLNYVSPDNPRPTGISNAVFVNSSSAKSSVCQSLKQTGFSENAVIGIMINFAGESGFIPYRVQGDYSNGYSVSQEYTNQVDNGTISRYDFVHHGPGGGGYGLAQWTWSTRKEGLYDFAKSKNTSIGDLGMQYEYFLQEYLNGKQEFQKYMTGNHSAYELAVYFCRNYENPNISCETERADLFINEMTTYVKNDCKE